MSRLPTNIYMAAQVRALDAYAIEAQGVPGYTLMSRAGEAALDLLRGRWPEARRLLVFCGGGNNGGDGYIVARLAAAVGLQVAVAAVVEPARLKGDARRAHNECVAAGVPVRAFESAQLANADVLVDAIFGTGLDRLLDASMRALIRHINASDTPVLALDLPSGLHADTGHALGAVVNASDTISFIGLKLGCFMGEGPEAAGRLHFTDLGVAAAPPELAIPVCTRLDESLLEDLQLRRRNAHKGDFGHLLIVGGGLGMPGAVRLCGEAALRSGAGLVTVATRSANATAVVAGRPELMCHGVDDPQTLPPLLERADVVVLGPGLGRDAWAATLLDHILSADKPAVVDADALTLLAARPQRRANWILTPHPGEAARLLGTDTTSVQSDRLAALNQLVVRFGGVVVLKGAGTLIGCEGQTPALCDRGNPGMATPGMGDVLSGVIAALLGQTHSAWFAARAAVLAHALAGDAAALAGERGLIASDVIAQLRACVNPKRLN